MIRAVAAEIGDPQVRHRGTIGGSVAHGDPASDLPAVLLALDATVTAQGPTGDRTIAAADLFRRLPRDLARPDELLTEIRVPKIGPGGFAYEKFNRRAQDWATVGAVAVRTNGAMHVALVNMGSTPLRAPAVESGAGEWCVVRRRRGARGRRNRASRRSQRDARVPRAPGARARAARARSGVGLKRFLQRVCAFSARAAVGERLPGLEIALVGWPPDTRRRRRRRAASARSAATVHCSLGRMENGSNR